MVFKMILSDNRKELKIVLNTPSDFFKANTFLIKNNFNLNYPSRFINSFYFDNNYIDHKLSIEGITPRKKIRIRAYGNYKNFNINFCNLEKKSTLENSKKKITMKWNEIKLMQSFNNNELLNVKKLILNKILQPTICVSYFRKYFINNFNVRCTLDSKIEFFYFRIVNDKIEKLSQYSFNKKNVLEIKSDKYADNFLEKIDLNWQRFSKYSSGISSISS